MKEQWFFVGLFVGLTVLAVTNYSSGWFLQGKLFFDALPGVDTDKNLRLQNESLKAEVARLESVKRILPVSPSEYIGASVYSRYPFNFKNELLISVGRNQKIASGEPAVLFTSGDEKSPILVGKVDAVYPTTSVVRTIFDSRFQLPVRIGINSVESLLVGGTEPKLTLIERDAKLEPGDIVYSASSEFPYGLPVGEVGELKPSKNKLFNEGTLKIHYDLNAVRSILLLKPETNAAP